ncbi:MAG: hypothetical protein ACM3SY_22630 [Candidatus Omnitrophota bacterium]
MPQQNIDIWIFTEVIVGLIVLGILIYAINERKKKKHLQKKFMAFSETHQLQLDKPNARTVPRIKIPPMLDVFLTLTDDAYFGLKAHVTDISLAGFSAKPDFPLKKLPTNIIVNNVLIVTPINNFAIKEMKAVRIDHQINKRLMAFHIEKIDPDQQDHLNRFVCYLDEFLKMKKSMNGKFYP